MRRVYTTAKFRSDVATHVRALRQKHGLTQAEFAKRAGVSPAAIAKIEQRHLTPSLGMLELLAGAVGEVPTVAFDVTAR